MDLDFREVADNETQYVRRDRTYWTYRTHGTHRARPVPGDPGGCGAGEHEGGRVQGQSARGFRAVEGKVSPAEGVQVGEWSAGFRAGRPSIADGADQFELNGGDAVWGQAWCG